MKGKPFVKWAGGKGNLLEQLNPLLPQDFNHRDNITYIEPFVGGGAMLFNVLHQHNNIRRVVINDINRDLIHSYRLVKSHPDILIDYLHDFSAQYQQRDMDGKEELYYTFRDHYNHGDCNDDERAALFVFLNHTCYNGLFRVNANGYYNVPFGQYASAIICNDDVIMEDHRLMNSIDFLIHEPGDYREVLKHISTTGRNFVYIDPPYRPVNASASNFKEYSSSSFGDPQQVELKVFCDKLSRRGCWVMISNSDSKNDDGSSYFEQLFEGYNICRVEAPRPINANGDGRSKVKEVLIRNY